MFIENFTNFIKYYGKGKELKLVGFAILSFIAGLFEFIGVALIYPFILLIIQPESNPLSKYVHIDNSVQTGLLLGLCVLLIFIIKNSYIIFSQYIQAKFVINWKNKISSTFMQYFLYAPYKDTMKTSSDTKLYIINTLCPQAIENFVMRCLNLLTNVIILIMILLLLLIKYTIPAVLTLIFVVVSLIIQNKFLKNRTTRLSEQMVKQSRELQTAILESINNIKEIKILSSENIFFNKYADILTKTKQTGILQSFYGSMPPYFVEILVVISLLLLACILSVQLGSENSELIASFAIIAAAIFRIAPALNRVQSNIIGINTSREFVKALNNYYDQYSKGIRNTTPSKKLTFSHNIRLKNVNFSYNETKPVIKNLSLTINKGDFVGIIGLSGAGKSTLADIITGLLPVDSGELYVDDTKLNEQNFGQFRKLFGYVPQQINIFNYPIRENIAWGCESIDDKRVEQVLKEAQIYDVIKNYPEGIYSNIMVDSTGLSQGQKQRLAIARALYRDPEIIILDEATSSLDVQVEHEITEMLTKIAKNKTIIAIAHRLSTLKSCNKLVYMNDGKIVDVGNFEDLSARYPDFANLVNLSKIE